MSTPGICECGHAIVQHTDAGCVEIQGKCHCLRHRPGSVVVGVAEVFKEPIKEPTHAITERTSIPEVIADHEELVIPRTITRTPYDRFQDVRRSPERIALYDRVLLRKTGVSVQDQITFAVDEMREANYCLPPTCEIDGHQPNPLHASACIQRAMSALRQVRKMLGDPES